MAKDLALILKETRARLALTINDLSKQSGVNENSIKGYENGHYKPRIKSLKKLCECMGLSMDDVAEGNEYDYLQIKNPKNGCYTLVNKTKGFVVRQNERKNPYPFVKIKKSYDTKDVGVLVREARIRLGYSLITLAKKVGYGVPTVRGVEIHWSKSKCKCLYEITKVLKLSLEDILEGIEYDYIQFKDPKDNSYTLINKTKNSVVEKGKRKVPYPFVKIIKAKELNV